MPPRWSRIPTRQDPEYRRLDDRMNFAVHVAGSAAINSGAWFFRTIEKADWTWTAPMTKIWLTLLVAHALYVFAIAKYDR
jgi:hypothetical protein